VCNGDEALRHGVELLLAHGDQAASFLETPAMPFDDSVVARSLEGQCIGPYQVVSLIGTGGMGEVYRAGDTKLNRLVATKVLLPALANDPDRLARFSREAQLLASLNHPHIAQIHGVENAGGLHALVMELVEGPTPADRIAHGPIPIDEALTVAKQIAGALEAAHEQGIIHRDLKPANIKLRPGGRVKVLDFGLAKAIDSTSRDSVDARRLPAGVLATGGGVILGTAAYMSPEQARGLPVDTRATSGPSAASCMKCSRGGAPSLVSPFPKRWRIGCGVTVASVQLHLQAWPRRSEEPGSAKCDPEREGETLFFRSPQEHPAPSRYQERSADPGAEAAKRHQLFEDDKCGENDDHQDVHHPTGEQQQHQRPAATHTVRPVLETHPERTVRPAAPPAHQKADRGLAGVQT
jgi:serine/threonine protein kinase